MSSKEHPRLHPRHGRGASTATVALTSPPTRGNSPPSRLVGTASPNPKQSTASLQRETDFWKIEAKREKSTRRIERTKSEQTETRLRRQISFLMEESESARVLLDEVERKNDDDLEEMRSSKREALEELRNAEKKIGVLSRLEGEGGGAVEMWKQKCQYLSGVVEGLEEEVTGLKTGFDDLILGGGTPHKKRKTDAIMGTPSSSSSPSSTSSSHAENPISPAPSSVMSELNRTRVALSNSQLQERMLSRKLESQTSKLTDLARLKESNGRNESKLYESEHRLKNLQNQLGQSLAAHQRWSEWRDQMTNVIAEFTDFDGAPPSPPTPPEVATVIRTLRTLSNHCKDLVKENESLSSQLESHRTETEGLRGEVLSKSANATASDKKIAYLQDEVRKINTQSEIWKREATSMRDLLGTFENDAENTTDNNNDKNGGSFQALRISFASEQERTISLQSSLRDLETKHLALEGDHENVRNKFQKLKAALMKERHEKQLAETRACQAETLAGKGGFDQNSSRVLHMVNNPMMDAVRAKYKEEIDDWKMKLEGCDCGTPLESRTRGTKTPPSNSLDAQKLHQRLKESFKEQIGLFREGVYLLTGLKVDMFVDSERPKFKVRSMYGEDEEDHLLFIWPENAKDNKQVTSLDLLNTPYAKAVTKTDPFVYVKNYNSIPAFMASLTLELFEKQTMC